MDADVADKVNYFFSKYPKRSYPKGQILVFADESPDHIYYLTKGKVRQYDVSYRGDEIIVNIFKPPAYFPMSWAINKTPNKYFYKTEEPTELHIIPAAEAVEFIKANPDVVYDLLSRVYKGTDGLLTRITHLMAGSAKNRVMYELIIESHRFGKKQDDGSYKLSANEVDIAARAGLSRETVSREIHKLKDSGQVRIEHGILYVQNLPGLEKSEDTQA